MYIIYQILSFVKRFSESFLKKFSSKNGVQAVGKGSSGCRRGLGSRDSLIIIASSMTFVNRFLQVFLIFSTKFEGEVWARCILGRRRLAGTNYGGGRQEGCGIRWFWGMGERWKIDGSRREVAGRACPARNFPPTAVNLPPLTHSPKPPNPATLLPPTAIICARQPPSPQYTPCPNFTLKLCRKNQKNLQKPVDKGHTTCYNNQAVSRAQPAAAAAGAFTYSLYAVF